MENWKKILKTTYSVSDKGNVRNDKTGKVLKQQMRNGYLAVRLYANGTNKLYDVHRLVAEAFIPNPDNLPQINHKSEVKTENFVENLEWCNGKYNSNYGSRNKKISDKQTKKAVWICTPSGELLFFDGCQSAAIWLNTTPKSVSASIRQGTRLHKNIIGYVSDNK